MPLYNAEKYLEESIETALAQTFDSIEFLIIDDKGTDNSINIIHRLQQEHPRGKDIRMVSHSNNRGVAAARNTALKEAQGEYLFFLDSDDWITKNCIELLYRAIQLEQAEIAFASYEEVWEDGRAGSRFVLPSISFHQPDELAAFRYGQLKQSLGMFTWNVLYRLSFLRKHQLQFQPVTVWEDVLFHFDLTPLISSCVLLSNITYTYNRRSGSLSHYHARNVIPLKEIEEHLFIRNYCKEQLAKLTNKPYIEAVTTWVMRLCMETGAIIIDKRKLIHPEVPAKEIKKLLYYPFPLSRVINFRHYKMYNVGLCCLSKLPYPVIKGLLISYQKAIKTYRKLRK